MYNVYLVCSEINGDKMYKIGYTKRPIEKRLKEFKTGNGAEIYLVESFTSKWGTKIEALLKRKYSYCNISGEWFNLSESEILEFKSTCIKIHNNFNFLSDEKTFIIDNGWKSQSYEILYIK